MSEPRVLIYDIENSPALGWVWAKYQQDVNEFVQDPFILSFAYKWLGEKKVHAVAMPDFDLYKRDKRDDFRVVSELWHLFDEADVVVAHNGNRHDQGKARARFLYHQFDPPSPFREIDTLLVARRQFNFTANNLDELCRQLGIGRKEFTGGFDLWLKCMEGDPKAWATMIKYNKRDVVMLEELYLRLRPWMVNHPNLAVIAERPKACPRCGSEKGMITRGHYKVNGVTKSTYFQCKDCQAYSTARLSEKFRPDFK